MKPAPFGFARPSTLPEALELLSANPHAKVLAGGQSLIPLLSMRLASPEMLIDINGIQELAFVETTQRGVRVGALARHAEVEADEEAARTQPLLRQAARHVAHPTIRNRGTTVGSLVHADASAEMPVVLSLLGGTLTATSVRGSRVLPVSELFVAPMESCLQHDEIATEAFFPALAPLSGVAFSEVARRHGDYALCGVAGLVSVDELGGVTGAHLGYLSVSDLPTVVDVSKVFAGGRITPVSLADAAELALRSLEPGDDIHASAAYRRQLVRVLTRRVLMAAHVDALERGGQRS